MKKLLTILFAIIISAPAVAILPLEQENSIDAISLPSATAQTDAPPLLTETPKTTVDMPITATDETITGDTPDGDDTHATSPVGNDDVSDDAPSITQAEIDNEKKRIAELQENSDRMKANKNSTANKTLGGLSMGATGIGAMRALSGLSERGADENADAQMRAYLATFRCDYGASGATGGETKNLGDGNAITLTHQEYVNLADKLKNYKNALGLSAGIESEPIIDKASAGLYDDEFNGRATGAFASLSRAMTNADSADAAMIAQQRADTKSQINTGAIIAGAGIVGGIVGNAIINRDKPTDNSNLINAKYDAEREKIRNNLKSIEQESLADASAESDFDSDIKEPFEIIPAPQKLSITDTARTINVDDLDFSEFNSDTQIPIKLPDASEFHLIEINSASLFASGGTDVIPNKSLTDAITQIKSAKINPGDKLIVVGHTDGDRIKNPSRLCGAICTNEQLSVARAKSVAEYMTNQIGPTIQIESDGVGDQCATRGANVPAAQKQSDRKAEIFLVRSGEIFDAKTICNSATPDKS